MSSSNIPTTMKAMVLHSPGARLTLEQIPVPSPQAGQVLLKVLACGICRTDLHIIDQDLKSPKLPLIPSHEIVGIVAGIGDGIRGGIVVCGGIHMSDIPSFPYSILWEERSVVSVANLTREDGLQFFDLADQVHLHTQTKTYPLEEANQALHDFRQGRFNGAAVLVP